MLNCFQQTVKPAVNTGTTFLGAPAAPTNPTPSARSPLRQVVDCASPLALWPGAAAGPNHPRSSIANRKSKIKNDLARLPKHVRHQLNGRLEDGEPGKPLVDWLNGLPEVQEVLKLRFAGQPISEQNLSEWKQGGYLEWLKLQESRYLVQHLAEQAEDLAPGMLTNRKPSPMQSAAPIQTNQAESNPIKPDQTPPPARQASSQAQPDHQDLNLDLAPGMLTHRKPSPPQSAAPIQPNPTESNPIKPDQTPPPAREASPQAQPDHHPTDPGPDDGQAVELTMF
jgi:hypothetical protein